MKARVYHPKLGRFLQTDPIGYEDGMNWYSYVGNDPVNLNDPSGNSSNSALDSISKTFAKLNPFSSSSPLPSNRGENIQTTVPASVKIPAAVGDLAKTVSKATDSASVVYKPAAVINTVAEITNIAINSDNKVVDSVAFVASQLAGKKTGDAMGGLLKGSNMSSEAINISSNIAGKVAGTQAKNVVNTIDGKLKN